MKPLQTSVSEQQKRGIVMNRHETVDYRIRHHFTCGWIFAGSIITVLATAPCRAQLHTSDSTAQGESGLPQTAADSLRQEIARLRHQAAELRKKAARLAAAPDTTTPTDTASTKVYLTVANEPAYAKDTVELLSRESTDAFLHSLSGRKRGSRERGFGGALGMVMGMYAIDMHPVNELVGFMRKDAAFANSRIAVDKSFAPFQFSGITGYGAVGNGLRIGGTYNGGSRSYTTYYNDTTYNLEIKPSFGGFLIEKAVVFENVNAYFGGLIGSGTIQVKPSKATNSFTSISIDSDEDRVNYNELNARSLLIETHGGFTYTLVNWFHIGADLSAPLFFCNTGFVTPGEHSVTNGFVSINPGIRIRIMIGNIG